MNYLSLNRSWDLYRLKFLIVLALVVGWHVRISSPWCSTSTIIYWTYISIFLQYGQLFPHLHQSVKNIWYWILNTLIYIYINIYISHYIKNLKYIYWESWFYSLVTSTPFSRVIIHYVSHIHTYRNLRGIVVVIQTATDQII